MTPNTPQPDNDDESIRKATKALKAANVPADDRHVMNEDDPRVFNPLATPQLDSEELRSAAHKAMDAYINAGGRVDDIVIISRTDHDRNWQNALDQYRAAFADRVLAVVPEKLPSELLNYNIELGRKGYNRAIDQVTTAITNLVAEERGEKKG